MTMVIEVSQREPSATYDTKASKSNLYMFQ